MVQDRVSSEPRRESAASGSWLAVGLGIRLTFKGLASETKFILHKHGTNRHRRDHVL